jgi:hypothetical protein
VRQTRWWRSSPGLLRPERISESCCRQHWRRTGCRACRRRSTESSAPGGEVSQVYTSRRELPNRVAIDVGDVEVVALVKGQASGSIQPGGGEVSQVYTSRRELPNRVGALVGDEQVLCLLGRKQGLCLRWRDGEAERGERLSTRKPRLVLTSVRLWADMAVSFRVSASICEASPFRSSRPPSSVDISLLSPVSHSTHASYRSGPCTFWATVLSTRLAISLPIWIAVLQENRKCIPPKTRASATSSAAAEKLV